MDEVTCSEMRNIINIIKTSCYQNFMAYHNKVVKYLIYEFASDYSIESITDVILQFYNNNDSNISKIQICLDNSSEKITLCLLYLVGMIKYELDEKYKK